MNSLSPLKPRRFSSGQRPASCRSGRWDARGLVREVQPGPVLTTEPEEAVTLIPMGAARLAHRGVPGRGQRA